MIALLTLPFDEWPCWPGDPNPDDFSWWDVVCNCPDHQGTRLLSLISCQSKVVVIAADDMEIAYQVRMMLGRDVDHLQKAMDGTQEIVPGNNKLMRQHLEAIRMATNAEHN